MSRDEQILEKVTIRLHEGDKEILQDFYPKIGYNKAIRHIIHKHCKTLEEIAQRKANNERPEQPADSDELPNIDPDEYELGA